MTMERWEWQDQTEANTKADGNGIITVTKDQRTVWSGWAIAAIENPSGSLTLKRRITLDDDGHDGIFDVATIGPGQWDLFEDTGFSFDMARFLAQLEQAAQQQREAETAQRLGLQPNGLPPGLPPGIPQPPNRQQRRHPNG